MRNAAFFPAKRFMERWDLLGLFELSVIFQDLGKMAFGAVLVSSSTVRMSL